MECTLTPEASLILDKILSINKTNYITIDTLVDLTIHFYSPELTQYTIIRIDPAFFTTFRTFRKITTFNFQKFHKAGIKSVEIDQASENITKIKYTFDKAVHYKSCDNVTIDLFDLDFVTISTFKLNLNCVKEVIKKIKDDFVVVSLNETYLKINYSNTVVSMPIENAQYTEFMSSDTVVSTPIENAQYTEFMRSISFKIDRKIWLCSIQNAKLFSEHVLSYAGTNLPLNIIFRNSEMHLSTFISVEWI